VRSLRSALACAVFAENAFSLTPSGAGTATLIYLSGAIVVLGRSPLAIRFALFVIPFIFALLIALGSPVAVELGGCCRRG